MAQEESQGPIRKIATGGEFKPYLDAVSAASQRTRFTIFVLIAALLIIITTFRNTNYPDWINSRLTQLQLASACLQANASGADCVKAVGYAKDFMLGKSAGDETRNLYFDKRFQSELEMQIEELIKQRTEALTIHLPFFGLAIDINDLGLAGGLFLAPILFVLYASLSSEIDNIKRARRKAEKINDVSTREDCLELLLMAQLLSSPPEGKGGVSKGIYILLVLVAAFHFYVCIDDLATTGIAATLEGEEVVLTETIVEWVAFALVLFLCVLCIRQQSKLNKSLSGLADTI